MRQHSRVTRAARPCVAAISIFLLTLACAAAARAQAGRSATRTWVSATGSNTNPCTRDAPCRDLSAAVASVAEGGEVLVLDSGSYDAVEITKSVEIIAPEGVHAVIAPMTGLPIPGDPNGATAAVLVNAPDATVTLRNLAVNRNQSIDQSVRVTAVRSLHVEGCDFNAINNLNTSNSGIYFGASGRLTVRDTRARNNGIGIIVAGPVGGMAHASINGCRLDGNNYGVWVTSNSRVTVNDTVATGEGWGNGFYVAVSSYTAPTTAELSCNNCVVSNFHSGFVRAGDAGASLRVARSVVSDNKIGFYNLGVGKFRSLAGTNMVDGNETNRSGQITTFSADAP